MLRKILTAFIVPKVIAYIGRRYGRRPPRRTY
ncbi:hypothetical protein BHAOGJBA_3238 [Methylobacterium hispanicum]|jgi:hypothetical protein|uniref:Uncharacterized protein n=1 Tax=Methylobacterium hispanicum TaxID=270350 RepID=A0AAV4ZN18_9HYPH|nr:hypothetical protein BHAOGJBA_3238 [Methylobacterium hispanicum]